MKLSFTLLALPISTVLAGHMPDCSTVDVTDEASCIAWCGPTYEGAHLQVITRHRDTREHIHVEQFRGIECHCEHQDHDDHARGRARQLSLRQLEGDHEEEEEKACWIAYEFPTCLEKGIDHFACEEEMEGVDVSMNMTDMTIHKPTTSTCAELCKELGMADIMKNDQSTCHHDRGNPIDEDEGEGHSGHNHTRGRYLEDMEEEEHLDEHGDHFADDNDDDALHGEDHYSLCFCGTDTAGEEGILVCADQGWRGRGESHLEDSAPSSQKLIVSAVLAVLSFLWL